MFFSQTEQNFTVKFDSGSGSGQDGFSPIVDVATIDGGHRVTITDKQGTESFDVMDGETPEKGVDYWTEEDKAEIAEQTQNQIDEATEGISEQVNQNKTDISSVSERVAELENAPPPVTQITPEFAESVEWLEENGDQSKIYLLPDGYIYAYTSKTVITSPANQIPLSINSDGTPYNGGTGIKSGYRLNSSGDEVTLGTYSVTGFIPSKFGDTLRFLNISSENTTNTRICFYDSSFAYLNSLVSERAYNTLNVGEYSITETLENYSSMQSIETTAYIRLSAKTINETSKITVNEPIEDIITTQTGWNNTGILFCSADYDNDISDLENRVSKLEEGETGESYVYEEAERVAKNVYLCQNANTFTFIAISDAHYWAENENIVLSNIHAGQGMDAVRKNVNVDFAVCLGDNGWGSGATNSANRATIETGIKEIRATNSNIDKSFRGIPNFRAVGNHDSLIYNYSFNGNDYLDSSELFPLYGAYNRGAVFHSGNKERGYCYRDFDDWKLRVICLNTSDIQDITPADDARPIAVSATQGQWFAETLDLSDKTDSDKWSILILSHAPLDWGKACIYLCDILKSYTEGGVCNAVTHDGVTITYNYAGKNAATIIGNCHGHNHNFKVDYLRRLVSESTTEAIGIKRFCIPNACFDRSNEKGENGLESGSDGVFDIEYGEAITYKKVAGTAEDTAFCVVTIDTTTRKINAHCYGAGYNREITY